MLLKESSQLKSKHEHHLEIIDQVVQTLKKQGIVHLYTDDSSYDGRNISIKGKKIINFGSCSYMGMEIDSRLKMGAIEAVLKYGSQFASSRAYISTGLYQELEDLLEKIFQAPINLGSTVTLCHQSNIPVLVGDNDVVILDNQVHESIQTCVSLLKLRNIPIEIIRHNSINALEERIKVLKNKHDKIWYMADGVYSMLGDFAPMQELKQLMDLYPQFQLYIDDAHGMGWAGLDGAGYVKRELNYHPQMYLVTSLAKSFGACGGVMVFPDNRSRDKVRNCGNTMIFSGPLQPPVLGSAIASAKIHLSNEIYLRQQELQKRISFFKEKVLELNLPLIGESDSPIFFIGVGKPEIGYKIVKSLMNHGYYINLSVFPSVSYNQTGLRIPITLHHTLDDIESLLLIIAKELNQIMIDSQLDLNIIYKAFKILHHKAPEMIKINV
ncbi:aminotransferase class I/II-fold pyridoxal phosphate-dependent enzyme [soil metagenome]